MPSSCERRSPGGTNEFLDFQGESGLTSFEIRSSFERPTSGSMASLLRFAAVNLPVRQLCTAAALLLCALNARSTVAGCGDYLHYVPRVREERLPVSAPAAEFHASRHDRNSVRLPYVPRKCQGPACNPTTPAPTSSSQMVELRAGSDRLLTTSESVRSPETRVSLIANPGDLAPMPGHPVRLQRPPRS